MPRKINVPTHISTALRGVLDSIGPLRYDERRQVMRAAALLVGADEVRAPINISFDGPYVRSAAEVRASDQRRHVGPLERRARRAERNRKRARCSVCKKTGHNARAHKAAPSEKL